MKMEIVIRKSFSNSVKTLKKKVIRHINDNLCDFFSDDDSTYSDE